jgi:cytochrome c5
MNAMLRRTMIIWAGPVLAGAVAALVGSDYLPESIVGQARRQSELVPPVRFSALNLTMSSGTATFPPGPGSEIANSNCVMCHSTGMVLRQPPLTFDEWKTEIVKMRAAFGAPIPADQIDAVARYLGFVNGRKAGNGPSGVDNQAS